MSPPKPEERRRRYHKRSRNGCIDCKRKHIRCDEKKPLCTNCLVKGDSCGYADIKDGSPGPSSIKLEDDEYWDSGDGAAPLQGMSSSHLLVGGHQSHVHQSGSPHAGYGFDSYGHGDAGAHLAADDPLSRQGYYWDHNMAAPDIPTTTAIGYTMGSQQQPSQQQMYSWSDTTGGQAAAVASYWDPAQQDSTGSPAPPAEHHHHSHGRHHGSSKHSSRKDGSGRSRR